MVATGVALVAAVSVLLFGVGVLFVVRTDTVVTFQETFVGEASVAPPDADAGEGRAWRRRTLRRGGLVMAALGGVGLVAVAALVTLA